MKVEKYTRETAVLSLSSMELVTINNALDEACNRMDISEFYARVGVAVEEAQALLRQVHRLIGVMARSD